MIIDDFMFHVPKIWYRLYWGLLVALNILIIIGYVLATSFHFVHIAHYAHVLNLDSTVTVVLSSITLAYLLIGYWFMGRYGLALALLVGTMLNTLVLLNGINQLDPAVGVWPYIAIWICTAALSGMFGLPGILGGALISSIYVLVANDFMPSTISKPAWVLVAGVVAAGFASYPFWKRRFISKQEQQVNRLSGMLSSRQAQSEILIQSITDGIIVINTEGKITLMNAGAAHMTGWPIDEALNIDAHAVVKLAEENGTVLQANPFAAVMQQKKPFTKTLLLIHRDNVQKITVSLVISPVVEPQNGQVAGAVAVLRDVTEERQEEQQRAEFISTASHEMRTPVAAIEGYLALALNEKVSTIDTRARGYLEKAHTSTQHLGKLFQDLLTSAKAEDGRLSNHPAVIEVGSFLQQLVDDLTFAAQKKGLAAEFVIGSSEVIDATNNDAASNHVLKPLYYTWADPDRMREVITNLFDNACKYTEQGKISIGLTGDTDVVQLYIKDTGAGIPAEDIPHLFQKFYRVDNSATRTIGGTGLGLFICRKIVELYHGRIWVESELGKGSTFFINLPRLTTQKAQQLQAAEGAKTALPNITSLANS
jgi:PAS domain S-box-containing protein